MLKHLGTTRIVTTASLFPFLVPQLHPEGRERCKGELAERRVAALPALLAAASLQKTSATSSHPSASLQTSEGPSDEKNSASRLLLIHPVFNNTLLRLPFLGHPTVFSFYRDPGPHH